MGKLTKKAWAEQAGITVTRVNQLIQRGQMRTEEAQAFGDTFTVIDTTLFPPSGKRLPGRPAGS